MCTSVGLAVMPAAPQTIALYMRRLPDDGCGIATIERALAAIATSHVRAGFASPWSSASVEDMRAALRRELGASEKRKPPPMTRCCASCWRYSRHCVGLRDRALLTLGWAGAFRRSKLVALDVEDVTRILGARPRASRLLARRLL